MNECAGNVAIESAKFAATSRRAFNAMQLLTARKRPYVELIGAELAA